MTDQTTTQQDGSNSGKNVPIVLPDDLFAKLGLANSDQATKDKLGVMMQELVQDKINLAILGMLTPDERREMDNVPDGEITDWLMQKGINLGELIAEEVQDFRESMIADMAYLQGQIDAKKSDEA